jgi:hypothetical protein
MVQEMAALWERTGQLRFGELAARDLHFDERLDTSTADAFEMLANVIVLVKSE